MFRILPALPVSPATLHCDGTPLNGELGLSCGCAHCTDHSGVDERAGPQLHRARCRRDERGFNDLTNLDLRQVGATGGEFASLASVLSFGSSVAPLNISAGGNVTLGSGGTVALGSGGNGDAWQRRQCHAGQWRARSLWAVAAM